MRRLAVVAVLVAAGLGARATLFAERPVAVRVAEVGTGRVEATVTNSRAGTVRARRRSQLSPETSGRVVALLHREGDRVEEGTELLRMDDSAQRARLELSRRSQAAAQARYDETCVVARRARREVDRYSELGEEIVSPDRLDQLSSALESADAACGSAAAQVELVAAEIGVVEVEIAKTFLRAPFAGILADVSVEVGEFITPAPPGVPIPPVIDLLDPTSIFVSAPMDEVDSAIIAVGQRVRVTFDPFLGRPFEGTVVRIAPFVLDVQAQNRTVEIEVELTNTEFAAGLLPGTTADVEVILDVSEGVLRIPRSTLLEGGKVLVLEGERLVERTLEIGLRNWDWVEVRSGLSPGERVVTSLGSSDVVAGALAVLEDDASGG